MKRRYRDRVETSRRRIRRSKAVIRVPYLGQPETWPGHFARSVDTFSGLVAAAKVELVRMLTTAAFNAHFSSGILDLNEKEIKAIRTTYAKLESMRQRHPAIGYAADFLEPLTFPRRKLPEGHTVLLNNIFSVHTRMLRRYPKCGGPKIDDFTDAVLHDLGLGGISDDDLIGEEDFRGALQRYTDR